jgi:hypothetical protein
LLVPPLIVTSASKSAFSLFFAIQLGACGFDLLLNIFAVTSPPETTDEAIASTSTGKSFSAVIVEGFTSLLRVMQYRNFRLLCASAGMVFGVFWSMSTFSAQLLQPFGASEAQVGGMGFTAIALGSVAALSISPIIDRKRRYRLPVMSLFAFTALTGTALASQTTFSDTPSVPVMWCLYSILGMLQTASFPVVFEFAAELTHPIDASVSSGMLMIVANGLAALMVISLQPALGSSPSRGAARIVLGSFVGIYSVASAVMFFVVEDLRRQKSEVAEPSIL